jgi:hypothetical protein
MPVILGGNTSIYLASLTPPAPSLLLDDYPNSAVAYSLRQLRTAYTGAAIRVRRSSDNAEQDIGFVGGDLDTQSLLDFVGYNLWTYSEDISQAAYLKNRLNTTGTPPYLDIEITPDGLTTGDKIIEDTTLASHYISRSTTAITNATDYNISVYLKQGERTKVFVSSNISGIAEKCDIDLTNGNTSNNTFVNTPVVTSEANGWYRFSVTITSGTTSSTIPIRIGLNNGTTTSYTGDGTSGAYVWGFQLTQSSSVLPYGKTVADAARNGFITTWYDQSGNANNATQPTLLASQAQIVSAGTLITDVDTGKISTTWTNDRYTLTSGISTNTQYLSISMHRVINANDSMIHLGNSSSTITPMYLFGTGGFLYTVRSAMSTLFTHSSTSSLLGRNIIASLKNASNLKAVYRNGAQLLFTSTEAPSAGTLNTFGQASTLYTLGQYQEYIYWDSEQSANRTGIETDINTYWNAY